MTDDKSGDRRGGPAIGTMGERGTRRGSIVIASLEGQNSGRDKSARRSTNGRGKGVSGSNRVGGARIVIREAP